MPINKQTITSWIIGTGMGLAFATGGWAMSVRKDTEDIKRRVEQIEQPFTELRIEMARLREQMKALTDAVEGQK
jgi:hypothetical protein